MILDFLCPLALAIDGDTLSCHPEGAPRFLVRLAAIDAPELPGHCRRGRDCAPGDPFAAHMALGSLVHGQDVPCTLVDANPFRRGFQPRDPYRRRVASCTVNGVELSTYMLAHGARVWP